MNRLRQTTRHVFMVRPVRFAYNPLTAQNNAFQKTPKPSSAQSEDATHRCALFEFEAFVSLLNANKVHVTVVQDTPEPHTPDSIFPNNGFSLHQDGTLVLYPMFAPNRRLERKAGIRSALEQNFVVEHVIDLTHYEEQEKYLEGTGSMILDHEYRIAYACRSLRTHEQVFFDFCGQLGYRPVLFDAFDRNGQPIYHTNVMMCVATEHLIVCMEAITAVADREAIRSAAAATHKEIIPISITQMEHFAGNMLQLHNAAGKPFLVLSATALRSLTSGQKEKLERHYSLLAPELPTIEENGGGSARCMIAECFAPPADYSFMV
ncbi:MAG: arginine deiminase-related protein [Bacteroidales bacterium]|nr:arginine deiminase-related protein [Bacteroidales bacterium]